MVAQELLDVLASLPQTLAAVSEPRTALFNHLVLDGEVEQIAFARDAYAVHHVELCLAEGRRQLVLHHLDARAAADDGLAFLDAGDATDVDAHRGIELQRASAGRRLGVAEHHANLLAKLVDEDETRLRLRDDARQLPQRLRHEPRLKTHLRFAHLAFDFGARHERGDRIDNDHVDSTGANQNLDDLERLLAVVGL